MELLLPFKFVKFEFSGAQRVFSVFVGFAFVIILIIKCLANSNSNH